jgi:hypothetical protein
MLRVQAGSNYKSPAVPAEARLAAIEAKIGDRSVGRIPEKQKETWRRDLLQILQDPRPVPEVQRAARLLCERLWIDRDGQTGIFARHTTPNQRRTRTTFMVAPGRPIVLFERLGPRKGVKDPWNSLRIISSNPGPVFVRLISLSPDLAPVLKLNWHVLGGQGHFVNRSNTSAAPYLHPSLDVLGPVPMSPNNEIMLRVTAGRALSLEDVNAGIRRASSGAYLLVICQPR